MLKLMQLYKYTMELLQNIIILNITYIKSIDNRFFQFCPNVSHILIINIKSN